MPPEPFANAALDVPYLRILLVLGLTLLVSLAAALVMRRFVLGGTNSGADGRLLQLKDSLTLGPRRTVLALEANGRTILLASTQDRITFLSDLGPTTPAAPPPEPAIESEPSSTSAPEGVTAQNTAPAARPAQPAFASVLEAARQFQTEGWATTV